MGPPGIFNDVNTVRSGDPESTTWVVGLDTEQLRILDLLGVDAFDQPGVAVAAPRTPKPGDRTFKPVPRHKR